MKEKLQHCTPERHVHVFNGNTICACGELDDEGNVLRPRAIALPAAPDLAAQVSPPSAAPSLARPSHALLLDDAAAIVAYHAMHRTALEGAELDAVHESLQAMLATIRPRIA